jgi:hypothetical protein
LALRELINAWREGRWLVKGSLLGDGTMTGTSGTERETYQT